VDGGIAVSAGKAASKKVQAFEKGLFWHYLWVMPFHAGLLGKDVLIC
jgi:hypothetical protein